MPLSRSSSLALLLALLALAPVHAQPTFEPIPIDSNGNSRGYWQFLPSQYHQEPNRQFPILIFFHGLGNGGDGDDDLAEVLANGPPKLVDLDLANNVFEDNQVVMLAPQVTNNTWWNEHHIRPFLDYVLATYRVDETRIYFTGLSAGSAGIHQFMNDDDRADQVTAFLTVAVRGKIQRDLGAYLAAMTPYWGLTARGDASTTLTDSVNRLAGFLAGVEATNVMAVIRNDGNAYSAWFQPDVGWQSQTGVSAAEHSNPLVTLYPGGNHNTWDITYDNPAVWSWLFAQAKPELSIVSPVEQATVPVVNVNLRANAIDLHGQAITDLVWSSDRDGYLGTGKVLQVSLSEGIHQLEVIAIDTAFRGHRKSVTVVVNGQLTDVIFADGFGSG